MKKIMSLLLALCMIATMIPAAAATKNTFTDVAPGDYFHDAVDWAVGEGITNGMTQTEFGPYIDCTRGHVVTFLWRAAGCPEPASEIHPFVDVAADQFYYKAVLWAVEKGITSGTSATTFSPNAACTRAQVVTFLWRYFDCEIASAILPTFTDVGALEYYTDAVFWALANGIAKGMTETTFEPETTCNRAQVVTFLQRADALEQPEEPGHTHRYCKTTVEATCERDGGVYNSCVCGHKFVEDAVPALGHQFGEWATNRTFLSTNEREVERECGICHTVEYEMVPMGTKEPIDIDALIQYAHKYAESIGFTVDTTMDETNSGYYPALDYPVYNMEEAKSAVRAKINLTKKTMMQVSYENGYTDSPDEFLSGIRIHVKIWYERTTSHGADVYWIQAMYG